MIHHKTTQKNEHYGVSYNYEYILVQLQSALDDRIEQVRIALTVEEAEHLIQLLQKSIENQKDYKNKHEDCLGSSTY